MSDLGSSKDAAGGFDWENLDDLTSISVEDLQRRLESLAEEERAISYRRRIIQGRIDLIRAEIVRRGEAALSPEDLARVLMGDTPRNREGGGE